MDGDALGLVWALLVLVSIAGGTVGVIFLYRQNKAKSERTQAMFGANPVPGGQGGGPGIPAPGQSVVLSKRTYAWPDRTGYYVTFQVAGQPPVEVEVTPEWFAYLNAGDLGALSLQGGQFHGFSPVAAAR